MSERTTGVLLLVDGDLRSSCSAAVSWRSPPWEWWLDATSLPASEVVGAGASAGTPVEVAGLSVGGRQAGGSRWPAAYPPYSAERRATPQLAKEE